MTDAYKDIEKLEADLWEAADNLRANSSVPSSDYFMPVLGVIFLRHAANRFDAAALQIADDQAAGRMAALLKDYVEPLFRHLAVLMFQNQKLRGARDLLLQRVMSGGIAV